MTETAERRLAADVAIGKRSADLVLLNGRYVEVNTGRIESGDIAIAGRRIAAIGDVSQCMGDSTSIVDCTGLIMVPGLINPHIHVGGSQLSIERLAEVLVPAGTAAICTDFYEPATIAGIGTVEESIRRAEGTGLYILLSPFHATALGIGEFGNLGRFSLDDLLALANHERAIGIREWNYGADQIPLSQISDFYRIAIERRLAIEGHLEGLSGPPLQASIALGVMSDHETVTATDASSLIKLGITVQLREGSGAKDLAEVVKTITEEGYDPRNFSLATDEQELHSLARDGYMDHKVRLAVEHGVAPIDAIRMATLTAAQSLGVQRDFGSLAPGKVASVAAVDSLGSFRVRLMVSEGVLSARDGSYLIEKAIEPYPAEWYDTVDVKGPLRSTDFQFDHQLRRAEVRVIGINPGSLVTEELIETVDFVDRHPVNPSDLATVAVIDRHSGSGEKGIGLVRGFGMAGGAIATTINPGVMNLLVLGVDSTSMATAANRVTELGGGIVAARGGEVLAEVSTPLFGIFSDRPSTEVIREAVDVADAIRNQLGVSYDGLITSIGFAALAVIIPSLKICDKGLVRVARDNQEAVDFVVRDFS